jgi:hypothetical protein
MDIGNDSTRSSNEMLRLPNISYKPNNQLQLLELVGRPVLDTISQEPAYILQIGRNYGTKGTLAVDTLWAERLENLRLVKQLESEMEDVRLSKSYDGENLPHDKDSNEGGPFLSIKYSDVFLNII